MKIARPLFFLSILFFFHASYAHAHELRPAYLEMSETKPGEFSVLWKVPARGDKVLGLHVNWPAVYEELAPGTRQSTRDAFIERRLLKFSKGLIGESIAIQGLSATQTDVLARIEFLDGTVQTNLVKPDSPSFIVVGKRPALKVVREYLALGIEHILTGADHLLFVLALILITRGGWKLVKTVTAFTVAHSLTLTAAALGFVHVPPRSVEAVIALSIVFVASEILRLRQGQESITSRAPWIVAFTFGLLHGLGFAGALSEVGLPQGNIPLALLFFSIGAEAGHFLFVGTVLVLVAFARRMKLGMLRWAGFIPPYAIGVSQCFGSSNG